MGKTNSPSPESPPTHADYPMGRKQDDQYSPTEEKVPPDVYRKVEAPVKPTLCTLGEGPVAPVEAAENARTATLSAGNMGEKEDMGYIEPGMKGWLNLLGVSDNVLQFIGLDWILRDQS
jgi:hypothetical protein